MSAPHFEHWQGPGGCCWCSSEPEEESARALLNRDGYHHDFSILASSWDEAREVHARHHEWGDDEGYYAYYEVDGDGTHFLSREDVMASIEVSRDTGNVVSITRSAS